MQAKLKEEQARLVKRAAFISREVRRFWDKSGVVVKHLMREAIDARKRALLDKVCTFDTAASDVFSVA